MGLWAAASGACRLNQERRRRLQQLLHTAWRNRKCRREAPAESCFSGSLRRLPSVRPLNTGRVAGAGESGGKISKNRCNEPGEDFDETGSRTRFVEILVGSHNISVCHTLLACGTR